VIVQDNIADNTINFKFQRWEIFSPNKP